MRLSISPERARQIRALFDELVALSSEKRAQALASVGAQDASLQREVEALLAASERADATLAELGEPEYLRRTYAGWDRLQLLFDRACTMHTDELAGLLDNLTVGDQPLRPELESLLFSYLDAPDLFAEDSSASSAASSAPEPPYDDIAETMPSDAVPDDQAPTVPSWLKKRRPPPPDKLVGMTIARYQVTARLGKGGMGVVYKAVDTSLDREVALKFLPDYLIADEQAEARFVQEAKAASALDHPNIAVMHEINRTDDGQMFIAMAYYRGGNLRDKIREGPMEPSQVVLYALQVAMGLQRAHEKGIVHRDIKPENLMLTEQGQIKIVDFGLAKMQHVNLTRTGMTMGTLAYMSPEQAMGQKVDHRTDLWALGVIIYEMLAGKRPFQKDYEAATLYAITNLEPEPIVTQRPEVPEGIAQVVGHLMQKDPDVRYATTAELVHDLQVLYRQLTDGASSPALSLSLSAPPVPLQPSTPAASPPAARPAETAEDSSAAVPAELSATAPPTQSRLVVYLAGAIALVVVAVLVWRWTGSTGPPQATPAAREEARALERSGLAYLTQGQTALAQAELERALAADSTYASAWSTLAAIHIQQSDFDTAIRYSERAIQADSSNTAAYYNLAFSLEEIGVLGRALAAYTNAVQIDPTFIQAYSALSNLLIEQDNPEEALRLLDQALINGPNSEYLFLIYKNIGKAHLALGNAQQALPALEASLQRREDWPETLALLAIGYRRIGETVRSDAFAERYRDVETDPAQRSTFEATLLQ